MPSTQAEPELITIGVPVHNGASTLARQIDSLVAQTYGNLEILVFLNGCTDSSFQIARQYVGDSRVRLLSSLITLPLADSFGRLAREAAGTHFMWAAADDFLPPNHVEELRSVLTSTRAVGAFSNLQFHSEDGGYLGALEFVNYGAQKVLDGDQAIRDMVRGAPYFHAIYGLWEAGRVRSALPIPLVPMSDLIFCGLLFSGDRIAVTGTTTAFREISTAAPHEKYPNDPGFKLVRFALASTIKVTAKRWLARQPTNEGRRRVVMEQLLPLILRLAPQMVHDAFNGSPLLPPLKRVFASAGRRAVLASKDWGHLSYSQGRASGKSPRSHSNL